MIQPQSSLGQRPGERLPWLFGGRLRAADASRIGKGSCRSSRFRYPHQPWLGDVTPDSFMPQQTGLLTFYHRYDDKRPVY